jgi:general secretion pathway protein M
MMERADYQRWLALGLLVAVLLAMLLLVVAPLLSSALELHEQKSELLFRLQRQRAVVARQESVAQNLSELKQQFAQQGYFTSSDTEALASAELQNIIKTAVNNVGGQLTSTQSLPSKTDQNFIQISVKVRMTGSMETLAGVLQSIEHAVPLLIITQLDITPVRGLHNPVTNKPDPSAMLNVSFDVVSLMRNKSHD